MEALAAVSVMPCAAAASATLIPTFDTGAANEIANALGNSVGHHVEIQPCRSIGVIVMGENRCVVIERYGQPDGLAADMDSEQCFLHKILRVRGKGRG